jgi:PII-like signaling protein
MQSEAGKKITIFTSEERRYEHQPLYEAIIAELQRAGIDSASVTRGVASFGRAGIIHTWTIEVLSYNLPITIEATDTAEKVDRVLPAIAEMAIGELVDVTPVQIVRHWFTDSKDA